MSDGYRNSSLSKQHSNNFCRKELSIATKSSGQRYDAKQGICRISNISLQDTLPVTKSGARTLYKILVWTLHICQGHEGQTQMRNCLRLEKREETWQMKARWCPQLDLGVNKNKGTLWDSLWNLNQAYRLITFYR